MFKIKFGIFITNLLKIIIQHIILYKNKLRDEISSIVHYISAPINNNLIEPIIFML